MNWFLPFDQKAGEDDYDDSKYEACDDSAYDGSLVYLVMLTAYLRLTHNSLYKSHVTHQYNQLSSYSMTANNRSTEDSIVHLCYASHSQ